MRWPKPSQEQGALGAALRLGCSQVVKDNGVSLVRALIRQPQVLHDEQREPLTKQSRPII